MAYVTTCLQMLPLTIWHGQLLDSWLLSIGAFWEGRAISTKKHFRQAIFLKQYGVGDQHSDFCDICQIKSGIRAFQADL